MQDLKRCSGYKHPVTKEQLKEPHETERTNFTGNKRANDGLDGKCRECKKAYENIRSAIPTIKSRKNETSLSWRRANTDHSNETSANWRKKNPDKVRTYSQNHHALKNGVGSEKVNPLKLIEIHGDVCYLCGNTVDLEWSASNPRSFEHEHVIPLKRGGSNTYANSRVACRKCNGSKGPKTYFEYEVQRSTHYVTIENLYLFNEVYEWHVQTFWAELRTKISGQSPGTQNSRMAINQERAE